MTTNSYSSMIEIVSPHSPGGPSDMILKYLTYNLPPKKYQIVYKPGAATFIAMGHVSNNPNSFLISTFIQTFVTNPLIKQKENLSYNNNLKIIANIAIMPSVLICNKNTNITNILDLKNTKKILNFGIAGYGSTEHLTTEMLFLKIKKTHTLIPYSRGGNLAISNLLAGHLDCIFSNYPTAKSYIENDMFNVIISSQQINKKIPYWKIEFNEEFPFESRIGIAVSVDVNQTTKTAILNDIDLSFTDDTMLTSLGFIPIVSTNSGDVIDSYANNKKLKILIETNSINLGY